MLQANYENNKSPYESWNNLKTDSQFIILEKYFFTCKTFYIVNDDIWARYPKLGHATLRMSPPAPTPPGAAPLLPLRTTINQGIYKHFVKVLFTRFNFFLQFLDDSSLFYSNVQKTAPMDDFSLFTVINRKQLLRTIPPCFTVINRKQLLWTIPPCFVMYRKQPSYPSTKISIVSNFQGDPKNQHLIYTHDRFPKTQDPGKYKILFGNSGQIKQNEGFLSFSFTQSNFRVIKK